MNKSGFTLIELLLTIVIIGVLAAGLMPNLIAARQRANATSAQAYLRNLAIELEANRNASSGALVLDSGPNCVAYLGNLPQTINTCTISLDADLINFTVSTTLSNSGYTTASYASSSGIVAFSP